jgi:hypothetical protein
VPTILRQSEELLNERNPKYLQSKVEDRLIQRGKM